GGRRARIKKPLAQARAGPRAGWLRSASRPARSLDEIPPMYIAYIILPGLLIAVVLASVWLDRWSVPVIIVALAGGIVSGSDFLGLWECGILALTTPIATSALVFTLFPGGFVTKRADFRAAARPAGGLAT